MEEIISLKEGETGTLPDGRKFRFLPLDIECMDNPCDGCILEDAVDCTHYLKYTGYCCGLERKDEKNGIFLEVK